MAGSVNKVILLGNLGRDPEIRHGQDGSKIATLSVATSESWKDRATGERKEKTEWHRVVIFNDRLCDVAERYLKKGSKIFVEGQLQTRKWTDNNGQEKYSTEIILSKYRGEISMLDSRQDSSGSSSEHTYEGGGSGGGSSHGHGSYGTSDLDDDIPF